MMRIGVIAMAALMLAGCAAKFGGGRGIGDLHDMPILDIRGEVVWSGSVVVDRIVVVRRTGRLVVEPGTRVLFKRVDWDGDGIGDCEITVEGELSAVGTPEAPILFASAEPKPAPRDWKYILVNFARGAELAYARVSHAYSGIQVHYSPATVRNSEFESNVDGVRFSTAEIVVEGNWLHDNDNGVRYEERGHPATVIGNEISDNRTGVFAVTECSTGSRFEGNNIRDNRYDVKMGMEQRKDIALGGNFWSAGPRIFDREVDPTLGKALIKPVLAGPVDVKIPPFVPPVGEGWR